MHVNLPGRGCLVEDVPSSHRDQDVQIWADAAKKSFVSTADQLFHLLVSRSAGEPSRADEEQLMMKPPGCRHGRGMGRDEG